MPPNALFLITGRATGSGAHRAILLLRDLRRVRAVRRGIERHAVHGDGVVIRRRRRQRDVERQRGVRAVHGGLTCDMRPEKV